MVMCVLYLFQSFIFNVGFKEEWERCQHSMLMPFLDADTEAQPDMIQLSLCGSRVPAVIYSFSCLLVVEIVL